MRNSIFSRRKRSLSLLLIFALLSLTLSGCSSLSKSSKDDKSFENFTTKLFQQEVSSNTISLHYTLHTPSDYGVLDYPVTYGGFSTDAAMSCAALENSTAALNKYKDASLSKENRLTYDVLNSYLGISSSGAKYLLYQEPLTAVTGLHAQLPVLLSEYQFYTSEDVDIYLQLMEKTGGYFQSLLEFEKAKSAAGLFMPDSQVDSITEQCRSFVDMGDDNYLYTTFSERLNTVPDLSDSEKNDFISRNAEEITSSIFPSYEALIQGLNALKGTGKNDKGLCCFPDGKAYYSNLVKQNTGISESIPKLQQMTKLQMAEDLQAMQKVLGSSVPTSGTIVSNSGSQRPLAAGTMFDHITFGQTDQALENAAPSSMLNDLKQKITDAFPEIPEVNVNVKYVPTAMEPYLSPAFYMIPAIDNSSDNVIYINQGQTVEGLNLYTTLAHEGYPGHLYQTVYYSSQKPDPIRNILDFGGYVEGWATYAEMMSYYLAPLSKNESILLQKNSSVILGLYALADMGIHYDGWTLTDTVGFFKDYGITDLNAIKSVYQLIIGDPGNYLKYYCGYLKFFNLKKEMAAELLEDFSQKEFHRAILDAGPAPFDIVEDYVRGELIKE